MREGEEGEDMNICNEGTISWRASGCYSKTRSNEAREREVSKGEGGSDTVPLNDEIMREC